MMSFTLMIILVTKTLAGYEDDLKKVNALGDRADSMLTKFGFNFEDPNARNSKKTESENGRPLFQVHGSLSQVAIKTGSLAFGTVLNRLVIGGEDSPVLITIESSQNGKVQGLRLLGKARQSSTPGRVVLDFDRLLLKSGKSLSLQAVGLDESGALGLSADVFSGKALMLAGSMAGSFLSGYAASQQTSKTNGFGFSQTDTNGRNSLLQGVAQTAADQSKRLIEDATQEKPVLVVKPGTKVSILFKEEVSL